MGRGWGERSSKMRGAAGFLQPVLTLGESRSHPDRASQEREESMKENVTKPREQEQELLPAPGASFPNLPWERRSMTVGGGRDEREQGNTSTCGFQETFTSAFV